MQKGDKEHRLKIIEGHLRKVIEMVENEEYCIDIIHQSQAVQSALKQVDKMILENHLHTCVRTAYEKGDEKRAIDELIKVFDKSR